MKAEAVSCPNAASGINPEGNAEQKADKSIFGNRRSKSKSGSNLNSCDKANVQDNPEINIFKGKIAKNLIEITDRKSVV